MYSLVLLTQNPELGNAFLESLGWGPNNFSVLLSPDGNEPATHYGLHVWVDQWWIDLLNGMVIPQDLYDKGISREAAKEFADYVVASFRLDMSNHFQEVIKENNLATVYLSELI